MMRNGKYFREIRESHEDKKGETGRRKKRMRCNRRIYRLHSTAVLFSFIRWNLGRESNPWFTIHAHVYQFRNDPIIRPPRGRSLPSLGPSPAIHCTRIKGECRPLMDAFRAFLFPTWYGDDVGGVFMRIAAGFRKDKRLRKSGFGCRRLDSQI